ncbi:MAG: helix-turn-helix transcriptional regulator [Oscillospiraceae bacterium]|nr:helix-turn-helix transcriptional regulator [Oscillospiraceae bacterium]
MFRNKTSDGRNNICGVKIAQLRKGMKISQRQLADNLQIAGLDVDKNAVQRMESGQRFVTDIEIIKIAEVLGVSIAELLDIG